MFLLALYIKSTCTDHCKYQILHDFWMWVIVLHLQFVLLFNRWHSILTMITITAMPTTTATAMMATVPVGASGAWTIVSFWLGWGVVITTYGGSAEGVTCLAVVSGSWAVVTTGFGIFVEPEDEWSWNVKKWKSSSLYDFHLKFFLKSLDIREFPIYMHLYEYHKITQSQKEAIK